MPRFRPRLRFSLRTMLVLVTVLGAVLGYVGWQWRIVQERNVVRDLLNQSPLEVNETSLGIGDVLGNDPISLPWIRRMLGDRPLADLYALPDDEIERKRILHAFPEEEVFVWNEMTGMY